VPEARPRRSRLGVAILFDAETTAEIDGLRRGLGEPDRGRIPPHLTLVPPINVREVDDAHAVVRRAGQAVKPFMIELGPVATFLPDNPVAYLAVGGDTDALHALRDAVFQPPLERDLTWPFVPHVTVADGIEPDVIAAAPTVLADFRKQLTVTSLSLLEEREHRWAPIGTYPVGKPAVVGRGGQPLEIDVVAVDGNVVITGYRDGLAAGSLRGWCHDGHAWLSYIEVGESSRRDGVGTHLLAAFESWAASRDMATGVVDPDVALPDDVRAFLMARGWPLS